MKDLDFKYLIDNDRSDLWIGGPTRCFCCKGTCCFAIDKSNGDGDIRQFYCFHCHFQWREYWERSPIGTLRFKSLYGDPIQKSNRGWQQ